MNARPLTNVWRALATVAVLLVPVALFVAIEMRRPDPFSSSIDAYGYFFPIIRAQTEAWLHGTPLRVMWSLGAGENPWHSGQTGVLWPLYPVAALVARVTGLALLDASALLSMCALGLVALWLLPRRVDGAARILISLALAAAPAPILLGLEWHDYIAPAPAFLAAALFVARIVDEESARDGLGLVVACALFFAGAHVQMYAIGVVYFALFALALSSHRSDAVRACTWLVVAQLPLALPMLWFKLASSQMAPDWLDDHTATDLVFRRAPSALTFLLSTFTGEVLRPLHLVNRPSGAAFSLAAYFDPALVVVVVASARVRRLQVVPFVVVALAFLCPRAVPFLGYLAVGPFAGFRWTYKLLVFVVPLTILLAALLPRRRTGPAAPLADAAPAAAPAATDASIVPVAAAAPDAADAPAVGSQSRHALAAWGALVVVELAFAWQGSTATTLSRAQFIGGRALAERGHACAEQLGIVGERIAVATPHVTFSSAQKEPLLLLALQGNGAPLAGVETAHVFEPLESKALADAHLHLSTIWRTPVAAESLEGPAAPAELARLASVGVQVVVAAHDDVLDDLAGLKTCSVGGERLFAAPVPHAAEGAFPLSSVERDVDGTLTTRGALDAPPDTLLTALHHIAWRRLDDGRWRGTPDIAPTWLIAGTALAFVATFAGALLWFRRRSRALDGGRA